GKNVLNTQSLKRDGHRHHNGSHEPHQCRRRNPTTLTYGPQRHQWLTGYVWRAPKRYITHDSSFFGAESGRGRLDR
ncbi:hypothetical protein, partial [Methylicorpusculum sp.]|uniref:hypothetical protein n=1 Tax=Methylicorpusculum sp. TaxID=2713644 RepID=UPI002ABBF52D